MRAEKAELRLLALSTVLAAGVFILDLSIPLGVAGGVPYVALVLVSLWSPRRRPTYLAATAGTILTILGYFLSPAGGIQWMVLFNRALALFAIWIAAILSLQRKRGEDALRVAHNDLEVRVQQRTAALRESETRSRAIVDSAADGIITMDENCIVESFNSAAEEAFGYPAKEVIGKNIKMLMPSPYQEEHNAHVARYLETGKPQILGKRQRLLEGRRKDGTIFPIELTVDEVRLPDKLLFVGILRDITQRRRAEQVLAERSRQSALGAEVGLALTQGESLEQMLQSCSDALVHHLDAAFARIWTLNAKENVLELRASAGIYTHLDGHHARVPVGKLKIGMIARERRPHMTNAVVDDPRISDKEWAQREGMVAFAGHPLILEDRVVGVMALFARQPLTEATIAALASVADQIALGIERKRAEEALRESEQRLQAVLDNTTAVIYMKDADGRYLLINRRFEELFHVTREEIVGKTDYDVVPREHADALRENDLKVLELRTTIEFEEIFPQDDGPHTYISVKFPLLDTAGTPYAVCGVSTDITARKRAEEEARKRHQELAHMAHLDAIGEMATDLARELNRPLAGIENHIQNCLVKARMGNAEPRELLEDMEHAATQARRAGEIVDRIHEFIRARGPRRTAVGINTLVREAADLVESEVRDNGVQVRMELAEKLPAVMVESTQIEQVIVNLIRNGLEAMADNRAQQRQLTIETSRADSGSVNCRIRDAGPGLPAEAFERVFEPFYTTKANGLGVGLSISQSIVEAHGGRLWASVNQDRGATFQFTLPIC